MPGVAAGVVEQGMPPKEDAPRCGLCGNRDWGLSSVVLTRKGLFRGENLFHVELMICLKCANEIEREFLSKALKSRIVAIQEDARFDAATDKVAYDAALLRTADAEKRGRHAEGTEA